jgi:hypothetical protein
MFGAGSADVGELAKVGLTTPCLVEQLNSIASLEDDTSIDPRDLTPLKNHNQDT